MIPLELEAQSEAAEFRAVLAAYQTEEAVLQQTDPEHNGWVQRLIRIGDLEPERLSHIHGQLIAFGYLKFQLGGRTTGVQYRISPEGRKIIERTVPQKVEQPSGDQSAESAEAA
ncbi:MAG: hypothetical protein Tsb009_12670 [Planctomycetaceae bacterium]